jgi:ubiquinone/menaquinone biosynthesis C-methylase UbiE
MTSGREQALQREILEKLHTAQQLVRTYLIEFKKRPLFLFDGPLRSIPQRLLDGCVVLESRQEILRRLPKGKILGEVGTLYGDFAVEILEICEPTKLEIIDASFANLTVENERRLKAAGCGFYLGNSWDVLATFEDHHFDMLYIDARHTYEAVSKDLEQAGRVVAPGGLIVCNDYTLFDPHGLYPYGVVQATNEYALRRNLTFVYFALQVSGYYDVALRNC